MTNAERFELYCRKLIKLAIEGSPQTEYDIANDLITIEPRWYRDVQMLGKMCQQAMGDEVRDRHLPELIEAGADRNDVNDLVLHELSQGEIDGFPTGKGWGRKG